MDPKLPGLSWSESEQAFLAGYKRNNKSTSRRFNVSARTYFSTKDAAYEAALCYADACDNVAKGTCYEMTVEDYLGLTPGAQRVLLLYRAVTLNFSDPTPTSDLPVDPYYLGLWNGDGSRSGTDIANNHEAEIVGFLEEHATALGMRLSHYAGTLTYNTVQKYGKHGANKLLTALRDLGVAVPRGTVGWSDDRKHIPDAYKFGSEEVRLQVAAGLIDSDGCLLVDSVEFYFSQSERWHRRLFEDVIFLMRSLGFYCTPRLVETTSLPPGASVPFTGMTLRTYVSGDIHRVPTLLPRKQARERHPYSGWTTCSIVSVERLPEAQRYHGFLVDGNKRFLRSDFLVVHNSGFEESMKVRMRCRPAPPPLPLCWM